MLRISAHLFAGAGREKSPKLVPKISRVRLVGTLGVHLRPLVDEIPGFGAIIITLTKPPKINYKVDLGTFGGKIAGSGVTAFVDGLLPDILNGFLVWPQRIVTPLFDEKITGPLDALKLHHQGILKVRLLRAFVAPASEAYGHLAMYTTFASIIVRHSCRIMRFWYLDPPSQLSEWPVARDATGSYRIRTFKCIAHPRKQAADHDMQRRPWRVSRNW